MKLSTVTIRLSQWRVWEQHLREHLELEAGDDARATDCPTVLRLPAALILDYDRAAKQAGWSLGQFLSFLAVQGALRVVEKGGRV